MQRIHISVCVKFGKNEGFLSFFAHFGVCNVFMATI